MSKKSNTLRVVLHFLHRWLALLVVALVFLSMALSPPLVEGWSWPRLWSAGNDGASNERSAHHLTPGEGSTPHGGDAPPAPRLTSALPSWREEREEQAKALWTALQAKGHFSPCWKEAVEALHARCGNSPTGGRNGNDNGNDSRGGWKSFGAGVDFNPHSSFAARQEGVRSRLALLLARCDAEEDGRSGAMFQCKNAEKDTRKCIRALSESAYAIFVQYRLHADVLCAYLQEEVFQQRTEAAVSALHSETSAAVSSMLSLQELEMDMLRRARESMELHDASREAVNALHEQVKEVEQAQRDNFNVTQRSAAALLEVTRQTSEKLVQLHEALENRTEAAMESILHLSHQTSSQYEHIQDLSHHVLQELNQMESSHYHLLSSALTLHRWLSVTMGVIVILLVTSPRRTAAARLPGICFWMMATLAPYLLDSIPLAAEWSDEFPWLSCGGGAASLCVGWAALTFAGTAPPPPPFSFFPADGTIAMGAAYDLQQVVRRHSGTASSCSSQRSSFGLGDVLYGRDSGVMETPRTSRKRSPPPPLSASPPAGGGTPDMTTKPFAPVDTTHMTSVGASVAPSQPVPMPKRTGRFSFSPFGWRRRSGKGAGVLQRAVFSSSGDGLDLSPDGESSGSAVLQDRQAPVAQNGLIPPRSPTGGELFFAAEPMVEDEEGGEQRQKKAKGEKHSNQGSSSRKKRP